ncbi:ion channel [Actinosynnema sp. NPDC047251]|uniref:Ion transport 2 domain-containing protein n=1 Tax=Saccharothrix espanaensis (strain ATCC 51144 / DSM 44229 / JCM 9112 / NBRC 15066 / NRRL 15764) TaxID=1179773 RepID=K0K5D8_SACES|nr:potassium channel family protein [Saccharothrix espanaensis]CCH35490.1 Ion transport 2 domain-containing protein [Saccharothrix espanaensis DSM 44229]
MLETDEPRLAGWERRAEWPLTVLAVVFLVAYAWEVLDNRSTPGLHVVLEVVLWAVWLVFAVDYGTRFVLAVDKRRFFVTHLFDLLAVLLPVVRQLRVLRLLTVLKVLNRRFSGKIRHQVGVYVAGVTTLVGLCASLAVLDAERAHPDATITTFGDAAWWTLTTISTVGYGDRYPVTWEGRLVAALLMIGGIALLGVITGTIASWLVERLSGVEGQVVEAEQATVAELRSLKAELAELRAELRAAKG